MSARSEIIDGISNCGHTEKYCSVKEGVKAVMGGKVLEYEAKTILRQGLEQGLEWGL